MDGNVDKRSDTQADEKDHFASAVRGTVKALLRPFTSSRTKEEQPVEVQWDESDVYSSGGDRRGIAVVIVNETFRGHTARKGSQFDESNLCHTLASLGFQVRLVRDCSVQELKHVLQGVAKEDHSQSDCFVLAMSTHGDEYFQSEKTPHYTRQVREDVVFCTDFYMTTRQLLLHFSDDNCPSLKGKPRLFFLQACRGGQLDPGQQVKVIHSPEEPMDEVDAAGEQEVIVSLPPCFKDFLIMYATPPGYYAFRRPTEGSWFVQALCAVLEHSDGSSNILKLLTSVTRLVAQEYLSRTPGSTETDLKKQTPCIYSMLTKDLFLKVADKKGEILTWG